MREETHLPDTGSAQNSVRMWPALAMSRHHRVQPQLRAPAFERSQYEFTQSKPHEGVGVA